MSTIDSQTVRLVAAALEEDVGAGDITSSFFVPADSRSRAVIFAKADGVVAGTAPAVETFRQVDPGLEVTVLTGDGIPVAPGRPVMRIEGSTRAILTAERTALNFLAHLSGVATLTRRFVDAITGTGARILDTRKTTPGWRRLEKAAVLAGGGHNHRMGLYDQVMVKDNHLLADDRAEDLVGGLRAVRERYPGMTVILEADTLDQVRRFAGLEGVEVVLLDNMALDDLREAVAIADGRFELEASGGVTLDTVHDIAATGVDRISVGALTHSAPALDLSLTLDEGEAADTSRAG